jgi:hypothetical protein
MIIMDSSEVIEQEHTDIDYDSDGECIKIVDHKEEQIKDNKKNKLTITKIIKKKNKLTIIKKKNKLKIIKKKNKLKIIKKKNKLKIIKKNKLKIKIKDV